MKRIVYTLYRFLGDMSQIYLILDKNICNHFSFLKRLLQLLWIIVLANQTDKILLKK